MSVGMVKVVQYVKGLNTRSSRKVETVMTMNRHYQSIYSAIETDDEQALNAAIIEAQAFFRSLRAPRILRK